MKNVWIRKSQLDEVSQALTSEFGGQVWTLEICKTLVNRLNQLEVIGWVIWFKYGKINRIFAAQMNKN